MAAAATTTRAASATTAADTTRAAGATTAAVVITATATTTKTVATTIVEAELTAAPLQHRNDPAFSMWFQEEMTQQSSQPDKSLFLWSRWKTKTALLMKR
jgi:hypothetical protein